MSIFGAESDVKNTSEHIYERVKAPNRVTLSILLNWCFVHTKASVERYRKLQWASAKFTVFGKRRFGTGCASIIGTIRMIKYTKSH